MGRGLLGTVTKPVGGVLDLVSGAMTSLREAARPSSSGRPRRRRPRRGLSTPLRAYSLAAAVGQMQLRRLAASTASASQQAAAYEPVIIMEDENDEGLLLNSPLLVWFVSLSPCWSIGGLCLLVAG